ncbi:MAG: hypothetical protein SFY66_24205 [Oculatellaceae cyanobacterium bins.114]|nr:hypothetical protein [Oculatellaceae cyanobacterium bins.114]
MNGGTQLDNGEKLRSDWFKLGAYFKAVLQNEPSKKNCASLMDEGRETLSKNKGESHGI